MKRGVVISPYFVVSGDGLHFPGLVGIESAHLRHYLLYWDKIDFPNNNLISIGSSPDIEYLQQCGVLQRTRVTLPGFSGNIGHAYIACQAIATAQLEAQEPGQWALAQSGPTLYVPQELSESVRTLEVELHNSLPSPGEDVALDDVLKFKEKYSDELLAFRSYMDELYLSIIQAGDLPRAKTAAIERLERSIAQLNQAADQSWQAKLVSGIKVEFYLPTVIEKAAAGAGVAAMVGLPLSLGAALGAVGSVINIGLSQAPKVGTGCDELAYLCHVTKELQS